MKFFLVTATDKGLDQFLKDWNKAFQPASLGG